MGAITNAAGLSDLAVSEAFEAVRETAGSGNSERNTALRTKPLSSG
jgi:hypothetical protein